MAELATHQGIRRRTIGQWIAFVWLNLWFWTIATIFSVVFICFAAAYILLFLAVVRNRRKTQWLIRRTISHYGAIVIRIPWPMVKLKYVDQCPGEKPPFVFVSNHRSSSDAYLMACLPFECVQVLNIWPGKIPVLGFISNLAGYLRVREMPFDEFAAKGTILLNQGCSIIAFPEGTRSGSARLNPFHGSSFRLAQMNHVKVAPLAIFGNEHIPSRGSPWLNPGTVIVSKLRSVAPEHYETMSPYKLKTTVREMIARHLDEQANQASGG